MKRNFAILFLIICAILSFIACNVSSDVDSSSQSTASQSSEVSSTTEDSSTTNSSTVDSSTVDSSTADSSSPECKRYAVRLYHSYDSYTVIEYEEGKTVDVRQWPIPEDLTFEGDKISFIGWYDEWLENQITENFVMPSHSMAFYAFYDMPQLFGWNYDGENDYYTSQQAGIRPVKNGNKGYYGQVSATFDIKVATTTGIGVIWNLAYGEGDYPYDVDCEYWYMHLNPTTGGFQLSKIKNNEYLVAKTISISASPESWQEKWNNWRIFGGTLTTVFSVDFTPDNITLYIDGEVLYVYAGDWVGSVVGNEVGIRTNTALNGAHDITFTPSESSKGTHVLTYFNSLTNKVIDQRLLPAGESINLYNASEEGYAFKGWYKDANLTEKFENDYEVTEDLVLYGKFEEVDSINGYNVYADGTYESAVANATMTVANYGARYGKWSTDITVTDRSNNRLGLLINAYVPTSNNAILYENKEIGGYYLHHNVSANVNFTLTTIYGGTYQGRPDGTKKNIQVVKYNTETAGALGAYYAKNKAFMNGETDSLTFNLAVEIVNAYIKIYVDGECVYTGENASDLGLFDFDNKYIGVGFTSSTKGTLFENYTFVEMQAVEVNKNGYVISADGKSYTSISNRAATTVDGITGKYGKWSSDVIITKTGNSRVGLYINAYVPTSSGLIRYDNSAIRCYYLHHSASANENFTLTTIYDGVYQGRPDGTKKNIQVIKYNAETAGALGAYHAKNAAFHAGETESLTFNLAIESMPNYVKIYVDGECIYTCETAGNVNLFANLNECVGVGFNTYAIGTTFTNFSFIPYEG